MPNLLCLGHITLDTFLLIDTADIHCDVNTKQCTVSFDYGAKIPVHEVHYGIGGGAANVVVGTKLLGINSYLYSEIGDDRNGSEIISTLNKYGVEEKYIKRDMYSSDLASIISYGTDRTIFTYNKDREFAPNFIDLESFDNIFLSSVGKNVAKLYEKITEYKKAKKFKLFFNPGSKEIKYSMPAIQDLLPYVDYLIANVDEGCRILNTGLTRSHINIEDLIHLLVEKGIKTVVLTDAENGVYFNDGLKIIHQPSKEIKVVEKTGAGDAFASGFISSVLYENDVRKSAQWGILNSINVMQKPGAQSGLMTFEQISKSSL